VNTLSPTDRSTRSITRRSVRGSRRIGSASRRICAALFLAALALLVIDALVVFWLAGGLHRLMPQRRRVQRACFSPSRSAPR